MPMTPELRHLAGEAALQIMMDSEKRAAALQAVEAAGSALGVARASTASADCADLLARASSGLILLDQHYRELQAYAKQCEVWAASEVERLELEAKRWERAGEEAERRAGDLTAQIDAMQRRIEAAELASNDARATLGELQGQVDSTFGYASQANRVMQNYAAMS